MFTGIITDIGTVTRVEARGDTRLTIACGYDMAGVDMGALENGHTIHVSDLLMPAGIELSHTLDPHAPVVSIHGARGEEEEGTEGAPAE